MNIGAVGKHGGVCDVKGTAVRCGMFPTFIYSSAEKENFTEFRFLAPYGGFPDK